MSIYAYNLHNVNLKRVINTKKLSKIGIKLSLWLL